MKVRLVTGYVPIPGHPRTAQEYGELGEKLGPLLVPKRAYYERVEDTWLRQFIDALAFPVTPSVGDNPEKNTLAYHCVNHQKAAWLARAAAECDDDVFVWVDYGIFSQPGVDYMPMFDFFNRVANTAKPDEISIPGCWPMGVVESAAPCWRFCGSVIVCPREKVQLFDTAMKSTAIKHIINTKNVEWEVNTLARLEKSKLLPIRWYKADHDVSQFNNYGMTNELP